MAEKLDSKKKKVVKKEKVTTKKSVKKTSTKKEVKVKKERVFKKIFTFFVNVKNEVNKVKWPSKKDMIKYSIATIVFILFFGIFFYGIEIIMAFLKTVLKG